MNILKSAGAVERESSVISNQVMSYLPHNSLSYMEITDSVIYTDVYCFV